MNPFELTNNQRAYFGLMPVDDKWHRQALNDTVVVYFNENKIVKVLNYGWGYQEYDTDINTIHREILLPKTNRGKEQKLTVPRLLKIKGSGVCFSGSFLGGGIHVYDNRRNLFFIKGYSEDGQIKAFADIDKWISNYISKLPPDYFEWLDEQLSQKRLKVGAKQGDIIAFRISQIEYGFARVLLNVFDEKEKGNISPLHWSHPRSLIVATYAFYADNLDVDIDDLVNKKTLPSIYIFDLDVYRGEMPIIGHLPLTEKDGLIPYPKSHATAITIPYTKTDIETFIAVNGKDNIII